MKRLLTFIALATGLLTWGTAFSQAPAAAPAGSTGLCKDGSYTSNDTRKGACAGHKGVKDWFGAQTAAAPSKTSPSPSTSTTPAAVGTNTVPAGSKGTAQTRSTAPAATGSGAQVWVNTTSKIYHCAGTKYYGKTKQGEYMTEAAAKAAGARADHGKPCS